MKIKQKFHVSQDKCPTEGLNKTGLLFEWDRYIHVIYYRYVICYVIYLQR